MTQRNMLCKVHYVFRNDRLRRARSRRKLTQEELAGQLRALGVSCSSNRIARWETGMVKPDCVRFAALCVALRVSPTDLVEFDRGGAA